jgi:hypothetical protein
MSSRILIFFLSIACLISVAEEKSASPAHVDNDFIHQQFTDSCSLESKWSPMTADLNGDGIEDIVIVARCKNPLIDQSDKNYKVIDPQDSFYGYGNTKITTAFGQDDPRLRGICLLVIHGSGSEAWRSETPLAKFVIINIAVKTITVKKMRLSKKKTTTAMYVEEATGDEMTAAIFWDGKKYRYDPLGSSME